MAKPIKETPILTGRDAVNFYKQMEIARTQKVSAKERLRMKESAQRLKNIEEF